MTWFDLERLGATWRDLARLGATWRDLARLGSTWLDLARLGSLITHRPGENDKAPRGRGVVSVVRHPSRPAPDCHNGCARSDPQAAVWAEVGSFWVGMGRTKALEAPGLGSAGLHQSVSYDSSVTCFPLYPQIDCAFLGLSPPDAFCVVCALDCDRAAPCIKANKGFQQRVHLAPSRMSVIPLSSTDLKRSYGEGVNKTFTRFTCSLPVHRTSL